MKKSFDYNRFKLDLFFEILGLLEGQCFEKNSIAK